MDKALLCIVYHSQYGHTLQAAALMKGFLQEEKTLRVELISVEAVEQHWEVLHEADCLVFGCPTLLGNVSMAFKGFMEATGRFWYKQLWKDKLAAGFTVSSTIYGDKANTLQSLFTFAAQHSMLWVSLGVLPRFINDEQTDGQNRIASYQGLMLQSDNSQKTVAPFCSGDMLTIELFARRLAALTLEHYQARMNQAIKMTKPSIEGKSARDKNDNN